MSSSREFADFRALPRRGSQSPGTLPGRRRRRGSGHRTANECLRGFWNAPLEKALLTVRPNEVAELEVGLKLIQQSHVKVGGRIFLKQRNDPLKLRDR